MKKKLELKKEVITELSRGKMREIEGGDYFSEYCVTAGTMCELECATLELWGCVPTRVLLSCVECEIIETPPPAYESEGRNC